jgi:hypothetical protein
MKLSLWAFMTICLTISFTDVAGIKSLAEDQKMNIKFAPLKKTDEDRLNKQRQLITSALKDKFGAGPLKQDKSDLKLIQKILDEKMFNASQTYELQSLGVVFGDVLAKELGLHWTMITDEYGTDPTLRYQETSLNINALTMISKRVEQNEPVDVEKLLVQTEKNLTRLKDQVDK